MNSNEQNLEQRASEMGWLAKDKFPGDPDKWTDAETFVRRGEEFVPFLKANNRKLQTELSAVNGKVTKLEGLLTESQQQIAQLLEINTAASRKEAKETKVELLTALETARKEGDVDTAVKIQTQIDEHETALKKADETKKPAADTRTTQDAQQSPDWKAWIEENPWYGKDQRRTRLSVAIAGELREAGNTLQGKAFFDEVAREVEKTLPTQQNRDDPSKVEGGRPNGGGGGGASGKRYTDLPSDARTTCDRLASNLKFPSAAFKDLNAYRSHYAGVYFSKE